MDIAQTVNYGGYSLAAYSSQSITSKVQTIEETKEVSDAEKLTKFKEEIWKEIDSMPWGCDISIHITDDAFKRMMEDTDFKERMLGKIREDASISGIKGGGTILNITEQGYSGFSWMEGYAKEGLAGVKAHAKDSFYYKKVSHKQDYMELWEERQREREVLREKLDTEYEKQLYMKQHWSRKERASMAYEANIMEAKLQK